MQAGDAAGPHKTPSWGLRATTGIVSLPWRSGYHQRADDERRTLTQALARYHSCRRYRRPHPRLLGQDEPATVRDLEGHPAVILPLVARRGGPIMDTAAGVEETFFYCRREDLSRLAVGLPAGGVPG